MLMMFSTFDQSLHNGPEKGCRNKDNLKTKLEGRGEGGLVWRSTGLSLTLKLKSRAAVHHWGTTWKWGYPNANSYSELAEENLELPLPISLLLLPGTGLTGRGHHTQFIGFWGLNSGSLAVAKALPPELLRWVLGWYKEINQGSVCDALSMVLGRWEAISTKPS